MASNPPPAPNIPASTSAVSVRVIDSTTSLFLNPSVFWRPAIEGFDGVNAPVLCFLVSNTNQNPPRHIILDLAIRKDYNNYSPSTVNLMNSITQVQVDKDIADILDSNTNTAKCAIRSSDIEAIIWSHSHLDHVGNPSTFPPSTGLVVGPGTISACWPGYPTNPDAMLLDSDIQGRNVREIDFTSHTPQNCQVGQFQAFDYFGDGSFYLLDAPGHCTGHICALARVTAGQKGDSFILMGGDSGHHAGLLRPSPYLPLPASLSLPGVAPAEKVVQPQHLHPTNSTSEPFLLPSYKMFPEYDKALETIRKIQELDALENVLVILPHDQSIMGHIPLFPHSIDDWLQRRLGERTRWLFVKDFLEAM